MHPLMERNLAMYKEWKMRNQSENIYGYEYRKLHSQVVNVSPGSFVNGPLEKTFWHFKRTEYFTRLLSNSPALIFESSIVRRFVLSTCPISVLKFIVKTLLKEHDVMNEIPLYAIQWKKIIDRRGSQMIDLFETLLLNIESTSHRLSVSSLIQKSLMEQLSHTQAKNELQDMLPIRLMAIQRESLLDQKTIEILLCLFMMSQDVYVKSLAKEWIESQMDQVDFIGICTGVIEGELTSRIDKNSTAYRMGWLNDEFQISKSLTRILLGMEAPCFTSI